MCISRKVEECTYNSFLQYMGKEYLVFFSYTVFYSEDEDCITKVCSLQSADGNTIKVPFGTEVLSHHMSPIEFRKHGNGKGCHKALFPFCGFGT